MSNLLTPAEVEAIRQRAEAITHGWGTQDTEQDYAFNAEVRSDIPRLLADREVLVQLLADAYEHLSALVERGTGNTQTDADAALCLDDIEASGVLAQVK